jgi:hypothetical protein
MTMPGPVVTVAYKRSMFLMGLWLWKTGAITRKDFMVGILHYLSLPLGSVIFMPGPPI